MNAAGYRKINLQISEETADILEQLQQTIINSNTGEEAIDNGEVPNFTATQLIDYVVKVGLVELRNGRWNIIYNEEAKRWDCEMDKTHGNVRIE